MPSNSPHHRSGAALYFIISGTGANTVDGKTEARGPGSLIYEPYALVHQWGNPGNEPLIFLTFNINPEGVAAVLPGAPAKNSERRAAHRIRRTVRFHIFRKRSTLSGKLVSFLRQNAITLTSVSAGVTR
jgi:hypothetical protein